MPDSTDAATQTGEAALVAAARRGDEAALREIVRQHNQTLYRLARSILPDDEAEDAVQEGYLRAFRNLDRFRGEAGLKTWLGRIVINAALERVRRRRPTFDLNAMESAGGTRVIPFPMAAPVADPEHMMAQDQIRQVLEQAIDELPTGFRGVVVARLIEELSVEETAQVLDLKPETVKTRLHRGRALLRASIEKRLGTALGELFPFGGERCRRLADRVIEGLCLRG